MTGYSLRHGLLPHVGYVGLLPLFLGLLPRGHARVPALLDTLARGEAGGAGVGAPLGAPGAACAALDRAACKGAAHKRACAWRKKGGGRCAARKAKGGVWSRFGLCSLSSLDAAYGKDENYWRGKIWINMNYLALQARLNCLCRRPKYGDASVWG